MVNRGEFFCTFSRDRFFWMFTIRRMGLRKLAESSGETSNRLDPTGHGQRSKNSGRGLPILWHLGSRQPSLLPGFKYDLRHTIQIRKTSKHHGNPMIYPWWMIYPSTHGGCSMAMLVYWTVDDGGLLLDGWFFFVFIHWADSCNL